MEDYDVGYENGYEAGREATYDDAYKTGEEYGYLDGHESGMTEGYDKGYEVGKDDTEKEMIEEIDTLRYNYQNQIHAYRYTIQTLKEEIYKLRIENATATRTISKST